MTSPFAQRILVAAVAAVFAFSCGNITQQPDGGSTADGGAGGGTGGGTGGGSGGGTGGGVGGGVGGGTGGGVGGGTGGGAGATCQFGQGGCGAGESCMIVDLGSQNFQPQCVTGACDVVKQDCPNGQTCSYTAVNGVAVRACSTAGTKQAGEACGAQDCAAGLVCAGSPTATCRKFCDSNAECGQGAACTMMIIPQGTTERAMTCAPAASCDVLLQNCPTATDACLLTASGPMCAPAGTAKVGEACGQNAFCEKGAMCVTVQGGGAKCVKLCGYPNTAPTCATGTCQQLGSTSGGPLLDGGVGACN